MKTSPLFKDGPTLARAVFGGTFNPPHIGHLRMAEEVVSVHELGEIIFTPAHIPPHKTSSDIADPGHRYRMTELSTMGNPNFQVSDIEIQAGGPSYTVDTLEKLRRGFGNNLFFIMGTDSLSEINTWKEHERLFQLASFIVVERPGLPFDEAWSKLPGVIKATYDPMEMGFSRSDSDKVIIRSPVKGLNISATRIRQTLRAGLSARYLVTDETLDYIESNGLYRGNEK